MNLNVVVWVIKNKKNFAFLEGILNILFETFFKH